MAERKLTDEEFDELGWSMVDRMLKNYRPQVQQPKDQSLKPYAMSFENKPRTNIPRLPRI